jgi:hypothetical protein
MKKRLLAHVCCDSCAKTAVIALAKKYDLVLFYYSPLASCKDYLSSLSRIRRLAKKNNCSVVSSKLKDDWKKDIKSLDRCQDRNARCIACIDHTLDTLARLADQKGIDSFTSTLSFRDPEAKIIAEEKRLKYNLSFLEMDSFADSLVPQDHCSCNCGLLDS